MMNENFLNCGILGSAECRDDIGSRHSGNARSAFLVDDLGSLHSGRFSRSIYRWWSTPRRQSGISARCRPK
jgi:hypothetical protein